MRHNERAGNDGPEQVADDDSNDVGEPGPSSGEDSETGEADQSSNVEPETRSGAMIVLTVFLAMSALCLVVGWLGHEATSGGSSRSAEDVYLRQVCNGTSAICNGVPRSEALEVGYDICALIDTIQPRSDRELVDQLVQLSADSGYDSAFALMVSESAGAATMTLCPEWGSLPDF